MSLLESFDQALANQPEPFSKAKLSIVGGTLSTLSLDWASLLDPGNLTCHSDGLSSSVYRLSLTHPEPSWPYNPSSKADTVSVVRAEYQVLAKAAKNARGLHGWLCVKRVTPDDQPQPHSVAREIALLNSLTKHENVAELLAAVYDETDPFGEVVDLVMPLYAATLEEVLLEPSLLPPSFRVETVQGQSERAGKSVQHLWTESNTVAALIESTTTQLLEAIAFLHNQRVAHRDIKPSNILLSPTGLVKLIDLGTAFTTTPLPDPFQPGRVLESEREPSMVHQLGTSIFRAPELLFAPKTGYDPFAIDVWSLAVTLAHFFTPLTPLPSSTSCVDVGLDREDERKDWQKAFESSTQLPQQEQDAEGDSPLYWQEEMPEQQPPRTPSGYIRAPLFEPEKGDIGLAASIFSLLGLPETVQEWPEAAEFQPPLAKLPFAHTKGTGLVGALPLAKQCEGSKAMSKVVEQILVPSLQLSAAKRPMAKELLEIMNK